MLKRMSSWNSYLNDCNELGGLPGQTYAIFLAAVFLLVQATPRDSFAQRQAGCDSVEHAWHSYFRADFDKALALVADCEEPEALELRVFVALKRQNQALAEKLLCKLLKSNPDYQPDPGTGPIVDFIAWVEDLRQKCLPRRHSFHDSNRLFLLPEANILESMKINLGAGTNLFNSNVQDNSPLPPFLVHMTVGLGDVAEFELGSIEVINELENGKPWLITGSLKFGISEGKLIKDLPALAIYVQRSASWLHKDTKGQLEYKKKLTHLLFVASKTFGPIRLQGGAGGMIPGLSIYNVDTKFHISFPRAGSPEMSDSTVHKWHFSGAVALQWRANSLISLMLEYNNLPKYAFNLHEVFNQGLSADSVKMVLTKQEAWLGGVRFSVTNSAFFDAGLMWRKTGKAADDFEQGMISFRLGMNVGFSIKRLF